MILTRIVQSLPLVQTCRLRIPPTLRRLLVGTGPKFQSTAGPKECALSVRVDYPVCPPLPGRGTQVCGCPPSSRMSKPSAYSPKTCHFGGTRNLQPRLLIALG